MKGLRSQHLHHRPRLNISTEYKVHRLTKYGHNNHRKEVFFSEYAAPQRVSHNPHRTRVSIKDFSSLNGRYSTEVSKSSTNSKTPSLKLLTFLMETCFATSKDGGNVAECPTAHPAGYPTERRRRTSINIGAGMRAMYNNKNNINETPSKTVQQYLPAY